MICTTFCALCTVVGSVTISRAFARKGKLKIFVRAQKIKTRAMRELWYFWRFLGSNYSYVVKNGKILKKY